MVPNTVFLYLLQFWISPYCLGLKNTLYSTALGFFAFSTLQVMGMASETSIYQTNPTHSPIQNTSKHFPGSPSIKNHKEEAQYVDLKVCTLFKAAILLTLIKSLRSLSNI